MSAPTEVFAIAGLLRNPITLQACDEAGAAEAAWHGRRAGRDRVRAGVFVALAIIDPDNPYRYVQIRGRVRRVTEAGAADHIDSLAKKYLGQDKYTGARPGEVRLMCEIEPNSASGMG